MNSYLFLEIKGKFNFPYLTFSTSIHAKIQPERT